MLSDEERTVLGEVQRRLVAEDPDLAASFDELGHRGSSFSLVWADGVPRWVYTTVAGVAAALSVLMVLAGGLWVAVVFVLLAGTAVAVRRRRSAPRRLPR